MSKGRNWLTQAVQDRLIALVLLMIVLTPLVATPADKSLRGIAAFFVEAFAVVLLGMLAWRAKWDLRKERVAAFFKTGANLPILLYLAWALASCLHSANVIYSIQQALSLCAGVLLYFVMAYQFRRSEHLSRLVDTILFVGIVTALVGFAQYGLSSVAHAAGPFGNDQLFGSFLMILLPIMAVIAISENGSKRQIVAQIATVLVGGALMVAHSRSAWVGAAAGLGLLSLLTVISAVRNGKWASRKHEVVAPAMLLAVCLGFFVFAWPQASQITEGVASLGHVSTDRDMALRQPLFHAAVMLTESKPLTGYGIGTYPYLQYAISHRGIDLTGASLPRPSLGEQAHDIYLQTAAELGIPGLLLLLAIFGTFLVTAGSRLRGMDPGLRRNLLMAAIASTVAVAIDGLASPSWQFAQTSIFFWMVMGMGVSCLRGRPHRSEEAVAPARAARILRPGLAVPVCLVATAFLPTAIFAADGSTYSSGPSNQTPVIVAGVLVAGFTAWGIISNDHHHPMASTTGGSNGIPGAINRGDMLWLECPTKAYLTQNLTVAPDDSVTVHLASGKPIHIPIGGLTLQQLAITIQRDFVNFGDFTTGDFLILHNGDASYTTRTIGDLNPNH